MWVSKVSELIGSSPRSFEDAARCVVARANRSLRGIEAIHILSRSLRIENDEIVEYRVRLRLIFDVAPQVTGHW